MPVSQTDVIDKLAIDRLTGECWLLMFEDRMWDVESSKSEMLSDLQTKLNSYVAFIHGGQLESSPEFKDRPIVIALHSKSSPPEDAIVILRRIKNHFAEQSIRFLAFVGLDRSTPVVL